MSYEAMPCVLKNEDGTPMYGLLIKPLQNQVVIQVANQQQQESQQQQQQQVGQSIIVSSSFPQSSAGAAVPFLALPPQAPATSNWNGSTRNSNAGTSNGPSATTSNRRHYQTILPRETASSSCKLQPGSSWATASTCGGYNNFNGSTNNGFAALVQNTKTPAYFAYTAAPSTTTFAAPLAFPVVNANGQQPSTSFTQAISSHGFLAPQSVLESNGANSQLDDQQFAAIFDQTDGGMVVSNDCAANSSNQNIVGGCSSTDLDSLLRDIDLSEITNSLMPLLQDCTPENGEDAFSERILATSATMPDEKNPTRQNDLANQASTLTAFERTDNPAAQVSNLHDVTATTSRPPCRYQGLLSNTSNLRVGCSTGLNAAAPIYSIFDPSMATNGDAATTACIVVEAANCMTAENNGPSDQVLVVQAQASSSDYEHVTATTPDSGIQSIGDSPHAVPQSSPMQFFSSNSPDARRRRVSSPRSQAANSDTNGNSTAMVVGQADTSQSLLEPQQNSHPRAPSSNLERHIGDEMATSSAPWPQTYMQPLSVNTAYFEPISECESSPSIRVPGNLAAGSQFPVLNTPRCYSPSTSSDCGNESTRRRTVVGPPVAKRKRRTKKRATGAASAAVPSTATTFDDMPVLHREGSDESPAPSRKVSPAINRLEDPTSQSQPQQSGKSKNDKEQLTLNMSDPNALVEKLLSVVPKEQLASLRRILDERLNDPKNGAGGNTRNGASTSTRSDDFLGDCAATNNSTISFRLGSALERVGLSRWQSKNAGYASDTSDVSSLADSALHTTGKKTTEEEGDSAASSGATWRERGASISQNLRRSSISSANAGTIDSRKQDPLKKLLEYRAKARFNCVKPTVPPRINDFIPSFIQLRIEGGEQVQAAATYEPLSTAFKKVRDKLAVLKDAPKLVKEHESGADIQKMTFNPLQNLETEASDDDEEENIGGNDSLSPCPELTAEQMDDASTASFGDDNDDRALSTAMASCKDPKETRVVSEEAMNAEDQQPAKDKANSPELVEVKENPQRKNISVKIKLSLLRCTSSENVSAKKDESRRLISRDNNKRRRESTSKDNVDIGPVVANTGKGKKSKDIAALPPKKRFKDGESPEKVGDKHKASHRKEKEDNGKRKRHHGKKQVSNADGSKKRKVATETDRKKHNPSCEEIASTLEGSEPAGAKSAQSTESRDKLDHVKDEGGAGTKMAKNTMRLGVFRKCGACKTWIRVEENDGAAIKKALCAECRKLGGKKDKETSGLENSKARVEKAKLSRPEKEKHPKVNVERIEKKTVVASNEKSANRTVKASSISLWKYPRKTYVKAGIFPNNDSSTDSSSTSAIFSPSRCRLLGAGADKKDFELPYDSWWQHVNQKDFICSNPSKNYRRLRSNVYVDAKPATGFQHHVCTCKSPANASTGACGDECLNRMMFTECCASSCPCGEHCTNNRFQRKDWVAGLDIFDSGTEKGMGVKTKKPLKEGTFVCEYMGEVVSTKTFGERMTTWYKDCTHHYALNLDAGTVIDGYRCGSVARLINHSCDPNCEMQKWWVNGQYRMGVFALRDIEAGEELSYNYKFHAFNTPQACLCASSSCRGFVDGSSSCHQARKSKPKRSKIREDLADSLAPKLHLLKPLSHRERVLVIKRRLFLLRNVDGLRRKLQALNNSSSEAGTSTDDEKRKAYIISSQLTALKTSRSIRTRRLAVSEDDAQIQKLAGLIQLLKPLLRTLMSAQDKAGKPLLAHIKKPSKSSKKQAASNGQVQNDKLENVTDFASIERNVERGFYTTPEAFDQDMKCLLKQLKSTATRESSNVSSRHSIEELERLYESEKEKIVDQLKDALGFQLSPDFVSNRSADATPHDVHNNDSTGAHNDQSDELSKHGNDDWSDELYWTTSSPFIVATETHENAPATLWSEKGDSFDKEDDKVHCVCGISEDDGMMIQCDRCRYWQHSECVGVAGEQIADDYVCEFCATGNVSLFKDVLMSPQPEIRLQHCVYYRSLMKIGLQVRIGECVYVKKNIDEKHKQLLRNFNRQCVQASIGEISAPPEDAEMENGDAKETSDPDSQQATYHRSDLRVFRVERLFTGPKGVRFVFGYYFARPHETFCEPNRRFFRNEIFVTPLYDTLPLDAVVGRCLVVDMQTYCKGRPKYPRYAEEDVYICEYKLDKGQRFFGKMHARHRYPICTKPYIFGKFAEKLNVKRDFTPFAKVKRSEGGHHLKGASIVSKKDDHSKKSKSDIRNDSGKPSAVSEIRKNAAKKKGRRVEQFIEKLKRK